MGAQRFAPSRVTFLQGNSLTDVSNGKPHDNLNQVAARPLYADEIRVAQSRIVQEKIMSATVNPIASPPASQSFRSESTTLTGCLLCRTLWPWIIQHRHLPIDSPAEARTMTKFAVKIKNRLAFT
jgi:hypothetical protein